MRNGDEGALQAEGQQVYAMDLRTWQFGRRMISTMRLQHRLETC